MRSFLFSCLLLLIFFFFSFVAWNQWIKSRAAPFIYTEISELPFSEVGVLLGRSKYSNTNKVSQRYLDRIEGAYHLYQSGKVDHFLLSGDNHAIHYNEPRMMRRDLLRKGVPESAITLDYAGFTTLDSVLRAKKMFGVQRMTFITQRFQCERACTVARQFDIPAQCYAVDKVSGGTPRVRDRLNEVFARIRLFVSLYILKTQPRFLNDEITLPYFELDAAAS